MKNVLILGAAGRDFHNFNVVFRNHPEFHVVALTATQIPNIAGRRYPPVLAGRGYPDGIPIVEENDLEKVIKREGVEVVVFSYSDVGHPTVMHLASRSVAAGADFWLLGATRTQVKSVVPVISVCAVRTGCGKSPVSRLVATELRKNGWQPVVIRHPMPYGDLAAQAVQRFATREDLDRNECTIEEREEYEPHIEQGTVVYAGVDYQEILRVAEKEADIILWDGGNNDTCFYAADLEIVVTDPHRAGHELAYYPGEVNLRRADIAVINKVDTAKPADVETVRRNIQQNNPTAEIVRMACKVSLGPGESIEGKRVLVVEDGPTLTHGQMEYGAGVVAATQGGARELVDPRPNAVGSIRATFEKYPHLSQLLPAMGYSEHQRQELEETIHCTTCDVVLVATPVNLGLILNIDKPFRRVGYEVEELGQPRLTDLLSNFLEKQSHARMPEKVSTR
jgi:predicted GTPase